MKVKISELRRIMRLAATNRGLNDREAAVTAEAFIEAELSGKKTHGVSKYFVRIDKSIPLREGKPEVIKSKFNYAMIDAHKELGFISAQYATDLLIKKARKYGSASVAMVNSYYYSALSTYAYKVARAGFIAVIVNNGGPSIVAPYGGVDAIFGSNPVAIGIPRAKAPIVLDMATSERPWGEVTLARLEKRKLQEKTFIDSSGKFTQDPMKTVAIIPFGQHRGYGLNFMFEILTGAFLGATMGRESKTPYDLGYLFLAFSPTMFTTRKEFDGKVERLIKEVKHSRKMPGVKEIYLPGERSYRKFETAVKNGYMDLPENTWNKLVEFSKGDDKTSKHLHKEIKLGKIID